MSGHDSFHDFLPEAKEKQFEGAGLGQVSSWTREESEKKPVE